MKKSIKSSSGVSKSQRMASRLKEVRGKIKDYLADIEELKNDLYLKKGVLQELREDRDALLHGIDTQEFDDDLEDGEKLVITVSGCCSCCFCGSEADTCLKFIDSGRWVILCGFCGSMGPHTVDGPEKAVELWNNGPGKEKEILKKR